MKKYLSLYFVFLVLSISIPSTFAGAGYSGPEFIPVDGKMCVYKEPTENIKLVYTEEDCLEGSDPATFQKFRKGRLLFGKHGGNVYIDKNAIYYFSFNGEWTRIEMDTKNLKKLPNNHITDGKSYFYNGLPYTITQFGLVSSGTLRTINTGLSVIGNTVYYRGTLEENLNGNSIQEFLVHNDSGFLPNMKFIWHGNTLLFPDGFSLHRIESDQQTFLIKDRSHFEDKNNYYTLVFGHYGFDIEVVPKK